MSRIVFEAHRRRVLFSLFGSALQVACAKRDPPEEDPLVKRFRGLRGGELRVDSLFPTGTSQIFLEDTELHFRSAGKGSFGPDGAGFSSYGGTGGGDRLSMPRQLRMIRFPEDASQKPKFPFYEGLPVVDVTVPVAERIPELALDDMRQDGELRLKLRFHPETLLVAWDVERWPTAQSNREREKRAAIYDPPFFSSVGGDFCEARDTYSFGPNGELVREWVKGWYIDPATQQRIVTDF